MTMPIRKTTTRLVLTGTMALGASALVAGPALAQYPPPPIIDITVTTPGATIEIRGNDWGPGTTVTITRRNGSKAGQTTTHGAGTNTGADAEPITVTVAEDGTFTAPVDVPADAGGTEIQYEVTGVDEQGEEKSETRALNVQLTSADMAPDEAETELAAPLPVEDDGGPGIALAAAGVAALAGGAAVARRKVRQG